jgi:Carboxypeptidase regulatory-like domain
VRDRKVGAYSAQDRSVSEYLERVTEPPPSPTSVPPRARARWPAAALLLGVAALVGALWWRRSEPAAPSTGDAVGQLRPRSAASAHPPRIGPGALELRGLVVDGAGAPAPGVEVVAELTEPAAPLPAAARVELSAITDAQGHFSLRGAAAGRYVLRVDGPGIFAASLPDVDIPGDELTVVVARKVSIVGRVSERGQPVAAAHVEIGGDAIGGTVPLRSSPTGGFVLPELPEGNYTVIAYRNDLASPSVRVARLGAGPFAAVELELDTAAVVAGQVFEADGAAAGAGVLAALELQPVAEDEPPRYAQTARDGRFRLEGVHRGRWVVSVVAPGYARPESVVIDAGAGEVRIPVVRGGAIAGRVLDFGGAPIAGAALRLRDADERELSGEDERAVLAQLSGRTAPAVDGAADDGAARRGDARFAPRGELGVLLGPLPPIPPPGVRAPRRPLLDLATLPPQLAALARPPSFTVPDEQASRWSSDAQGRYVVRGVPPGRYTVLAQAPGFADGVRVGAVISAGATLRDFDVALSVGTFIVGTLRDQRRSPVVGARLLARRDGPRRAGGDGAAPASASATATAAPAASIETRSNGDGTFKLGPLLGAVVLEVRADGHASAQRRVDVGAVSGSLAAQRREDFTLESYDAELQGFVDDAAGAPVTGAQVTVLAGPAAGRVATTGSDGAFALTQLPAGAQQLAVDHPQFPRLQGAFAGPSRVRIRLPFGGGMEGRVSDDAGAPVAGVRVLATGPGAATAATQSGRDGSWRLVALAPGSWRLRAQRPGSLPATRAAEVQAAQGRDQVTVRDVVLALQRGGLVAGTVRDRRGARLAGALIQARGAGDIVVETRSDARGEFRLRDCPTGELALSAEHGGARTAQALFLRPGQEILSVVFEVPTP